MTLYHGDWLAVHSEVGFLADLIVTDPPYGETSLAWDNWPRDWPHHIAGCAPAMWCFGSMRMFLDQRAQFADWRLSQDIVWEKHDGSGFATDRFRRVHEFATHWYRNDIPWRDIHHVVPRVTSGMPNRGKAVLKRGATPHTGKIASSGWEDDGTRIQRSVIYAQSMRGNAINETEKPVGLLEPLIEYGCPPGGLVLDPFAGSASTLVAARNIGRRAIGVEKRESQCEKAAQRLSQATLDFGPVVDFKASG